MSSSYSSHDAAREPAVRVVRRQLITAHGAKEMPTPRVVLHLPDLDALQAVALGPVRPTASRRRIDAAHDVEPTTKRSARKQEAKPKNVDADEADAHPLLNLLRIPLNKWLAPIGSGKLSAGSLVVLMQQPKVMLGAVVAVAMQLAAVLAMLGGGGTPADKSATPAAGDAVAHTHNHSSKEHEAVAPASPSGEQHASHTHAQRPIQTPLNVVGSNGQPFAGPSLLPAPQALTGVDAKDVPPWQAPVATLPTPAPNVGQANASPTAAPALMGTGNLAIGRPDGLGPTVGNLPSVPTSGPTTTGPTNVVQTSGPTRAKLKGTIQRKSGAN